MVGLAPDHGLDALVQLERSQDQLARGAVLTDAGEQVEERGGILADIRAAGQQAQIGVEPRGRGIVVAGAQMHIAADAVVIAPHHQTDLGMDLVADHAIDHVHPGLLESPGPGDVVGLVEAGLQFHHHGDLLAVLHRVHQGAHDPAVAAGAVQGLLDGQDARIGRGLLQELQHAVETLVGMVQQQIAPTQRLEDIGPLLKALDSGSHERNIPQFRGLIPFDDGHEPTRSDGPFDGVEVVGLEPQRGEQFASDLLGAIGRDLQPHGLPLAAVVQLGLHGQTDVGDLLLVDVELAVAGDAEQPPVVDLRHPEQTRQIGPDEIGQEDRVAASVKAG